LGSQDLGDPSSDPSSSLSGSESGDSMERRDLRESMPMPIDHKNNQQGLEEKEWQS